MNKYILSIALLLSCLPGITVTVPNSHFEKLESNTVRVFVGMKFPINQYLSIAPGDNKEWSLIDTDGLKMLKYTFIPNKPRYGIVGLQTWIFRAQFPGTFTLTFRRKDVTKTVVVKAEYEPPYALVPVIQ